MESIGICRELVGVAAFHTSSGEYPSAVGKKPVQGIGTFANGIRQLIYGFSKILHVAPVCGEKNVEHGGILSAPKSSMIEG